MPKTVMITISNTPPIITHVIRENDYEMVCECPMMIFKEEQTVYSLPYLPLAKDHIVTFNKDMIISTGNVDDMLVKYYQQMVDIHKENAKNVKYKIDSEPLQSEEDLEILHDMMLDRPKILH